MVYSNKEFPNKEFEFPAPPLWLTWIASPKWDPALGDYAKATDGKVRHQDSLYAAKRYIGRYTNYGGTFYQDWAIYEWVDGKYKKRFWGKKDTKRAEHELWSKTIGKHIVQGRDATDDEIDEVLASIEKSAEFLGAQ